MAKTIIVSNRLPVKFAADGDTTQWKTSEGGLATGLGSMYKQGDNLWIGWPGVVEHRPEQQEKIRQELHDLNLSPVFLTEDEISYYYEGFSNETLWPIFHYMASYAHFDQQYWDAYQFVNEKFMHAVLEVADPDDTIWIHDYQLLLLPGMLRNALPKATIGFFQHIPFPSSEIFRLIPWRRELLEGMLGADLVGFHTFDDARHFISSSTRLLPIHNSANILNSGNRSIIVEAFPMGIDFEKYESLSKNVKVQEDKESLKAHFLDKRIILSIDRLDYSKGILQRLHAFESLLQQYPEYVEEITLYMVVVPSRDTVPKYRELRDEVDKLVGNINARFRTLTWNPIHYFYRSLPLETLSALYQTAEVCLVTPMRDGMNLVCKEFIASRNNTDGVLILSEMAGASKELLDAILVNPNNIDSITQAIVEALNMPKEEQQRRMSTLRQVVSKFNIHHWVRIFMDRLSEVKE